MKRDAHRVRTGVNNSILGYYTKFWRVGLDDFELHHLHSTTDKESVTFAKRSVGYEWPTCQDHDG